ncbi:lipid asymmetry maintenance protein MlaB [Pectobacteriaceae bacterium CE90]|nr:lipid asymmetry maintenance protein MlaB [Prodigiosinella sp. LS101]WJV54275.1 lipid asymmetry maintenance protein MlaB [Prodigiosinella sp. LS101]WJV58637.1 lipid asymmetry maintenance protein MlaB [Pectobacteriaceae bacterium C111]WJY14707.1 lipid asymmetry maintenance protein MlaB [Pectobacteriaceae bacterium CE90]
MVSTTLNWKSDASTLVLDGDLDRETLLPLWQQRETLLQGTTVLDMSQVNRVDSSGLALLVHFYHQQQQNGVALQITGVSDRLKTLIELYSLDKIIPIQLIS